MFEALQQQGEPGPTTKQAIQFDMEDDDFEEQSKGFVPSNTVADTRKCVRLFQDWAKDRNARFPGDKVSQDILLTDDHQSLSRWLCKFCTEAYDEGFSDINIKEFLQF